jgi:hypothetical protein
MMEVFRGPTGVLPEDATLQSLINDRDRPPVCDGAGITALAEHSFRAGTRAVIEVFAEVTGKAIGPTERLRVAALAQWQREAPRAPQRAGSLARSAAGTAGASTTAESLQGRLLRAVAELDASMKERIDGA